MSSDFDPYRIWLSIPSSEQPANFYRLLGLPLFESDPDVISGAADRQMKHVRTFQTGKHSDLSQKILNELALARVTLLDPTKKSKYDSELRTKLNASKKSDSNHNHPVAPSIPQQTPAFEIKAPPLLPKKILEVQFEPVPVQRIDHRESSQKESRTNNADSQTASFPVQKNRILLFSGIAVISLIFLTAFLSLLFGLSSQNPPENKENLLTVENKSNDKLPDNANPGSQEPVENKVPEKKAGDRMVKDVDGVKFAFRWCPAGTFMMGSPEDEAGRSGSEKQHQVTLTKGFWILETEVTVGMFKAFVNETGYESKGGTPSLWNGSSMKYYPECSWKKTDFYQDDTYPVTCISWADALEFNKWLGSKIGQDVDLPTEAQWEYACRAGTTGAYNGIPDEVAWRGTNGDKKTHPVAQKQANDWGIYDMHGNVWELCIDNSCSYPSESVTDPVAKTSGSMRAIRGGSFMDVNGRSACRNWTIQAGRGLDLGFRCVIISDEMTPLEQADMTVGTKAGDRMVKDVNEIKYAFRWCPAGTFMMGSPENEPERDSRETQHQVTLTKGFWMMETEVTVAMFRSFVKETGYESKGTTPTGWTGYGYKTSSDFSWENPYYKQDDACPVTCISKEDVTAFCKWLGEKIGKDVQLPTEAQWEYACRAGTTGPYADDLESVAWYKNNSDLKAHPVGTKKSNAWGLCDMHGNLWEWCLDGYRTYTSQSVTDPFTPSVSSSAARGGSWDSGKENCRSASRWVFSNTDRTFNITMRCAIIPDNASSTQTPAQSKNDIKRIIPKTEIKPGDKMVKVVNGVEFAFRWCPPGTFMMGSPESEKGRNSDERQHQVTLTKGFWMMETEVTQKQWQAIMNNNPSHYQGDYLPVEKVSLEDCQAFCKKCKEQFGFDVQIPTEAQWEYACRAGTTEAFAGNIDDLGCYLSNSNNKVQPVGQKKPNAWGLYDMHGNVWEWSQDRKSNYPSESVTDPTGPTDGWSYAVRGGCWFNDASSCRSASRFEYYIHSKYSSLGFRCMMKYEGVSATAVENSGSQTSTGNTKTNIAEIDVKNVPRMVKVVKDVEFAFRWCPPGTFMMGSANAKTHSVTLTKGFWMMEKEVTQKQWKVVMGKNPSKFTGDDLPVERVSLRDCQEFCKKCKQLGLPVELPTEAQWEYACKAGSSTPYSWGSDLNGEKANCNGNFPNGTGVRGKYLAKTTNVGSYAPNTFGLYDMHGNVWEWCSDRYGDYPNESVTDPTGPDSGFLYVTRGGGWSDPAENCRSTVRGLSSPGSKSDFLGLRCVLNSDVSLTVDNSSDAKASSELKTAFEFGQGTKSGERKIAPVNGVAFAFRWCPPGTFMMGSPESEKGRKDDEKQHQVTLTNGFWMLETEVTQEQWKAIMGDNPSSFEGDNLPVEKVSWTECQDFCKKCSKLGLPVQLPTEAQWEYACRAGSSEAYAGNLEEMGWLDSNSDQTTHPVGTMKANKWGLFDMHGNVWEWCQDWKGDYPDESVNDPSGPSTGSFRVYRGGAWRTDAKFLRSANRGSYVPEYHSPNLGFRCVLLINSESSSSKTSVSMSTDKNKGSVALNNNGVNIVAGKREVFTINGVEFPFRWCPAGTFKMGSPESEQERSDNETQHQVTLSKGFWMLETEVTQRQWKAVMENNPSRFVGDDLPVENVSWKDCQEFCNKCKELDMPFQLPTEAQWEYACRAGTTGTYYGNLEEIGWYESNSDNKSHPSGKKKPNAWSLYDMTGNVEEWCQDWLGAYPSGNVTDPTGPLGGPGRVIRGGGWKSASGCCRSADRSASISSFQYSYVGFRILIEQ